MRRQAPVRWCVLLCLSSVLTGCVGKNEAILMAPGGYGDLAVIASTDEVAAALSPFLAEFNDEFTFVIAHEHRFAIDVLTPDKWHLGKGYKNILFALDTAEGGDVAQAVKNLLSRADYARLTGGAQTLLFLDEPFAEYQFAAIVTGPDRNTLISNLRKHAPQMREMIERKAVERILRRNRHDGLRNELMTQLWNKHRFSLEVPQDYALNQERPGGYPAVELMQKGPSRGLTIAWRETADPAAMIKDTAALLALRAEVGLRMHNEELVPDTFVWRDDTIGGQMVWRLEGAWNSTDFAGGGAFWCWFVPDPREGRVYCLDALAYAPGMDKMEMYRRMRAVLQSFSLERPQG